MPEDTPIAEPTPAVAQNWYPDEYKELVSQRGWGADGFLKSYTELEKAMSTRVKIPTDESTSEEKSAFYTRLGRPDTPDGYTMPNLPEGKSFDESLVGGMKTMAFEEGWTGSQWDKAVERYLAIEKQGAEAKEAEDARAQEETDRELKELWHADHPKRLEVARRAMRDLVKDNVVNGASDNLAERFKTLIEDSGLGDDSVFIQGMEQMGSKMLDDTLVKSEGQVKDGTGEGYVPSHPNSPAMYANGEDEESKKARAYFEKRGHHYG